MAALRVNTRFWCVICAVLVTALFQPRAGWAQADTGMYPNFQAKPLIDGNQSPLYKVLTAIFTGIRMTDIQHRMMAALTIWMVPNSPARRAYR